MPSITYALRDRALLLAEHQAVTAAASTAGTTEGRRFLTGANAALDWVLGTATTAPATGARKRATVDQMVREERYCDQMIYSDEARPALDPDYANGIEHALSWARGAETEPPTPLDGAALPEREVCTCG
jgi:hypothetical protein